MSMACVLKFALVALIFVINVQVKKVAFISSDSVGLSTEGNDLFTNRETFTISSLWQSRRGNCNDCVRGSKESFINILILLCGEVESCPGPIGGNSYSRSIPELTSLLGKGGIAIFYQNVRGLFSNINLISELVHNFGGIEVLTLSETHIQQANGDEVLYDVPGY